MSQVTFFGSGGGGGAGVTSVVTNAGTATPSGLGVINLLGDVANIETTAAGNTIIVSYVGPAGVTTVNGTASQITSTNPTGPTVTLSIPSIFIAPGSIEAAAGNITATDGNFVATAGNVVLPESTADNLQGYITIGTTNFLNGFGDGNVWVGDSGNPSAVIVGTNTVGIGMGVLKVIDGASNNVSIGFEASQSTVSGSDNVHIGYQCGAMVGGNGSGSDSVLIGSGVCSVTGANCSNNVIIGYRACAGTIGRPFQSTIIGYQAMANSTDPNTDNNTLYGWRSGFAWTGGESNNIMIGHGVGTSGDNNVCRIGQPAGSGDGEIDSTYIAGIDSVVVTGSAVLCSTAGQLGAGVSSKKFKDNVVDMDNLSSDIMKLRPVAFNYNVGADRSLQTGLIAEEVHEVMPQLVVYDKTGAPQTVKYHDLPALLLNEIQKLNKRMEILEGNHVK